MTTAAPPNFERRQFLVDKLVAGQELTTAELEEARAIAMAGEMPGRYIGKLQPLQSEQIREGWDQAIRRANNSFRTET